MTYERVATGMVVGDQSARRHRHTPVSTIAYSRRNGHQCYPELGIRDLSSSESENRSGDFWPMSVTQWTVFSTLICIFGDAPMSAACLDANLISPLTTLPMALTFGT